MPIEDLDHISKQDLWCMRELALGEPRGLPVAPKIRGQHVPGVAPVRDQIRPRRARLGQPMQQDNRGRMRVAMPVNRQREHHPDARPGFPNRADRLNSCVLTRGAQARSMGGGGEP